MKTINLDMDYGACLRKYPDYSITKDGNVISWKGKIPKVLTPTLMNTGYLCVSPSHNGKAEKVLLHRLIAHIYIPNPDILYMIDHMDGNRLNNDISNLRWVNRSINNTNKKLKGCISYLKKFDGKKPWQVTWAHEPHKRICKHFQTKEEAETYLEQLKSDYPRNYGIY